MTQNYENSALIVQNIAISLQVLSLNKMIYLFVLGVPFTLQSVIETDLLFQNTQQQKG